MSEQIGDLKPIDDLRQAVNADPRRRSRVDQRKNAMRQGAALGSLRRTRQLTQQNVAEELSVSQANISRIERGEDVYLSTLGSYIQALGGRVEVSAVFADRRYIVDASGLVTEIEQLGEHGSLAGIVYGSISDIDLDSVTVSLMDEGATVQRSEMRVGETAILVDPNHAIAITRSAGEPRSAFVVGVDSENRLVLRETEPEGG